MSLEDCQVVGSCLGEVVVEEEEQLASPPERRHQQGRKFSTPRMVRQETAHSTLDTRHSTLDTRHWSNVLT